MSHILPSSFLSPPLLSTPPTRNEPASTMSSFYSPAATYLAYLPHDIPEQGEIYEPPYYDPYLSHSYGHDPYATNPYDPYFNPALPGLRHPYAPRSPYGFNRAPFTFHPKSHESIEEMHQRHLAERTQLNTILNAGDPEQLAELGGEATETLEALKQRQEAEMEALKALPAPQSPKLRAQRTTGGGAPSVRRDHLPFHPPNPGLWFNSRRPHAPVNLEESRLRLKMDVNRTKSKEESSTSALGHFELTHPPLLSSSPSLAHNERFRTSCIAGGVPK